MPRPLPAARTFLVVPLIARRFPADTAHVPVRLLEVAHKTFHKPLSRIRFHRLRPTSRKDPGEKALDETRLVMGSIFHIFVVSRKRDKIQIR